MRTTYKDDEHGLTFFVEDLPLSVAIQGTDRLRLDGDMGAEDAQWFSDRFAEVTRVSRTGDPDDAVALEGDGRLDEYFGGDIARWEGWLEFCIEKTYARFLAERARKRRAIELARYRELRDVIREKPEAERTEEETRALGALDQAIAAGERQ